VRAWLLHLNFWELGALSWLPVLWGRNKPFIGTPKQEKTTTQRSTLIANFVALPKLLLWLNFITALIVAPFSSLYTPLLFACALIICLIKLAAAIVVFQNYSYTPIDTQIIKFKQTTTKQILLKPLDNDLVSLQNTIYSEQERQVHHLVDNRRVANAAINKNNEAANS
jgi:hypothetical protein